MKSSIYEFTREDWNTLYPIHLEDHNPAWKTIFEKEKKLILSNIDSKYLQKIEHFGSSSIPGIKSKPYIDIFTIEFAGRCASRYGNAASIAAATGV